MSRDVRALAALLAVAGVAHVVRPGPFESIVPRPLPHKRALVHVSGVAEVVCAGLLVAPRTRRVGGLGAAALLVAVFPANLQMCLSAVRSSRAPRWYRLVTLARLPLQAPLVRAALRAARA